jgi:hypothetical protein
MATLEPCEYLNGQPELQRRAVAREWLAQPSVQLPLGLSNEALVLFEENP